MYWYWQALCFMFQCSPGQLSPLCHAVYERLFSSLLGTNPPRPDLPDSLGSPQPMHPYHAGLRCPLPHQLVPFHSSLILSMGPTRPVQCPLPSPPNPLPPRPSVWPGPIVRIRSSARVWQMGRGFWRPLDMIWWDSKQRSTSCVEPSEQASERAGERRLQWFCSSFCSCI